MRTNTAAPINALPLRPANRVTVSPYIHYSTDSDAALQGKDLAIDTWLAQTDSKTQEELARYFVEEMMTLINTEPPEIIAAILHGVAVRFLEIAPVPTITTVEAA